MEEKSVEYIKNWRKRHRDRIFYNIKTGKIESTKEEQKIIKDYWFPEEKDADI